MNVNKLILSAAIAAALPALASCNDPECRASADMPYCNGTHTALLSCRGGKWVEKPCDEACADATTTRYASCITREAMLCIPNTSTCISDTMAMGCADDGTPTYTACESCSDGTCTAPSPAATTGLTVSCAPDGLGVVLTAPDGTSSGTSCAEMAGFDSVCEQFGPLNAGCRQPTECDETFSPQGTCAGDRLFRCNTDYIIPVPESISCPEGSICDALDGTSACLESCEPGTPASCAEDASGNLMIRSCVKSDGGSDVLVKTDSLCTTEDTVSFCNANGVQIQKCDPGYTCVKDVGKCLESCDEADEGNVKCTSSSSMFMCRRTSSGYSYVQVGARECLDGDILARCSENGDGSVAVTKTDCRNYVYGDEILECACKADYQYPDMDVCVPVTKGESCGGTTAEGYCDGSTLVYCLEEDDATVRSDCAANVDGFTSCSIYAGFADCRKPCSVEGSGSCIESAYGGYAVSMCVADDNDGKLSVLESTSICTGDILNKCDENGNIVRTDCRAFGGRCELTRCVYPACPLSEGPICLDGDNVMSCQVSDDGTLIGSTVQSVSCGADGVCVRCDGGQLSKISF